MDDPNAGRASSTHCGSLGINRRDHAGYRASLLLAPLFLSTLAAVTPPTTPHATRPPDAGTLARLDALHVRRDEPGAQREARRLADAAVAAAPTDYGALWRAARVLFTESDDPRPPRRRALARWASRPTIWPSAPSP